MVEASNSERWEYKRYSPGVKASLSDERLIEQLNELGREGWQLIAVEGNGEAYLFKRRIQT